MLTRRQLLRAAGSVAGSALAPPLIGCAMPGPRWSKDPFSLGVASGEPLPDGFVLWTRLAPEPLSPDPATPGGMSGAAVPVTYEIAADPAMKAVLRRGTALAEPDLAWSVHVEVPGLAPARPYWYRFAAGSAQSPVGRAMTAPLPGAALERLKFGFVSCANYEIGYFSAYRHLAEEAPDFVVFLGDYIYENFGRRPGVRRHSDGVAAHDLRTYRNRYAQYRTDPNLQRLHADVSALMTWDDHEVQNDYADQWSETFDDPAAFLKRRAAAYRAFYEHMPLRPSRSHPNGPNMRIYDRFAFGDLVEFFVLDGRQYRSREACYGPPDHGGGHQETMTGCPELLDPRRTFLGFAQERWLYDGLARSRARWNVIAQDQLMAQFRERTGDGRIAYWTDDWNGYPEARKRLLTHVRDARVANPVVIGGDIHSFWANDLKLDFDDPRAPVVASEFVGTSITSFGPPYDTFMQWVPDNPHVHFFESRRRGYVSVELQPERMSVAMRVVSDVADPKTTIATLKNFVVESGRAGPLAA
ncbi:MAG TPA: alkaline phosphatase D family protein [Stellaceae bacterium]|nr:alkaline phosphatase D family protein [Stellaceae bacterium]